LVTALMPAIGTGRTVSTLASTGSLAGSRSLAVTVTTFWLGAIVTVSVVAYSKRARASMILVPAVTVMVPGVPGARVNRTLVLARLPRTRVMPSSATTLSSALPVAVSMNPASYTASSCA
jgi:hypothetical protein